MGRNSAEDSTNDGTDTAEGVTNNTAGMGNGGPTNNNTASGTTVSGNNSTNDNMGTDGAVNINWKEDLKASVTIDMTNIQRALHKAYINAR